MLKKAIPFIPVISGFLIFIGFLNYHFYYSSFDIQIANFLTTGELIFSFLPLSVPFFLVFLVIGFVVTFMKIAIRKNGEDEEKIKKGAGVHLALKDAIVKTFTTFNESLKKQRTTYGSKFTLFIRFLDFLLGIASYAFVIYYFYLLLGLIGSKIDPNKVSILSAQELFYLGVIWLLIIAHKTDANRLILRELLIALISISLICLWGKRTEEANEILSGKLSETIKFNIGVDTIQSDSAIAFIGLTSKYVFLRNLKDSSNVVYNISESNFIELKSIKFSMIDK